MSNKYLVYVKIFRQIGHDRMLCIIEAKTPADIPQAIKRLWPNTHPLDGQPYIEWEAFSYPKSDEPQSLNLITRGAFE